MSSEAGRKQSALQTIRELFSERLITADGANQLIEESGRRLDLHLAESSSLRDLLVGTLERMICQGSLRGSVKTRGQFKDRR